MKETRLFPITDYGYAFLNEAYLGADRDEYRLRKVQAASLDHRWRKLKASEIEILVKNDNTCGNWDDFLVIDPFEPTLVKNSNFAGLVRLGKLIPAVLRHHDFAVPTGIRNSTIISCDIGDNCVIQDCGYLSHYIIGDAVILYNVDEIQATNHAKFGNGVVKDGESEEVRIWIDVINEAGGRSILPFDGMICADAYLWASYRDDSQLLDCFKAMTQKTFGSQRGAYGTIGSNSTIKSTRIIKDTAIGEYAYIKGANKLKNLTINSSEAAPSQIGEGVELVNGIIDYGCRIFYGCKAVRFVMGQNSTLKYGARLIHSVLGDNSTVSCCEILNNLIFPSHEQHHNNSFLIASLVQGMSNIAAGATIGSNHNSRSPDGEIQAGRGLWAGLCVTLKHSCRFASYCLITKGDYPYELNIRLPFALITNNQYLNRLEVMPAYFWMHNMYALKRNSWKIAARDQRAVKVQRIEVDYLAPDTVEEIIEAINKIAYWTGLAAVKAQGLTADSADSAAITNYGFRLLAAPPETTAALEVQGIGMENSQRPTIILKPRQAWQAYHDMLRWYAINSLTEYWQQRDLSFSDLAAELNETSDRQSAWINLGGQIVPEFRVDALRADIRNGRITDWSDVHAAYDAMAVVYPQDRAKHAWAVLGWLIAADLHYLAEPESQPVFDPAMKNCLSSEVGSQKIDSICFLRQLDKGLTLSRWIGDQVYHNRAKDLRDPFRAITYRNQAEMAAVLGNLSDNSFIQAARQAINDFEARSSMLKLRLQD